MVQYGNSFTFSDVYRMPIYLRNFYYNKLVESKKKEQERYNEIAPKSNPSKVRMR